jgi:biotin transport system substrate-specific component
MPKVAFLDRAAPSQRALPVVAVIAFSALLALSAKIEVPFWPVPMTLETFAVLALAGFFRARLAAASVLLWLVEGAAGMPVFAGPAAGPLYFLGPTAGYLAGFFLAAIIVGFAADRRVRNRPILLFLSMLAGVAVIYAAGFAWLAHLIGGTKAVEAGILPFIPADLTKAALAAALVFAAYRFRRTLPRGTPSL